METKVKEIYKDFALKRNRLEAKEEDLKEIEELENILEKK